MGSWPEPKPCKRKWARVPFDQMLRHIREDKRLTRARSPRSIRSWPLTRDVAVLDAICALKASTIE